jgi:hypothetical protein
MERIQELLGRLADLSDAEVAELEGLILTEFDAAESEEPTPETVETMVTLADALDSVRGETERRTEQAEALAQKAKEASARVRGEAEAAAKDDEEDEEPADVSDVADDIEQVVEDVAEAEEDVTEAEDEEEKKRRMGFSEDSPAEAELTDEAPAESELADETQPEAELSEADPAEEKADSEDSTELSEDTPAEADAEAPAETELSDDSAEAEASAEESSADEATTLSADADTNPQEDAVTASVETGTGVVVTPPADAAPVPSAPANALAVTITAGGDIPGYTAGSELSDMDKVADAFAKRLHSLRNVSQGTFQQTLATLSFEYPEDRQLHGEDPGNFAKVRDITSPAAITAAAGICAPLETIYDVEVCGDADRPIRDALARFNADRGGVRIFGAPTLGTCSGIWDPANPSTKNCCDANCPTPQDIGLEAVYACITFSNYTNRFFPEVVRANTDLAMINHAREAELNLLKKIQAASTAFDVSGADPRGMGTGDVGVTREFIRQLHNAAAFLRRKHRLSVNSPLRAILPSWVLDAMIADIAQQMPGDGLDALSLSAAAVEAMFRGRGVNVTWSLDAWDDAAAASAASAVNGFDTKVSFPLFPEGTFLFLDGGTLDLGVTRDSTMLEANEYATFVETFEGVAQTGCESLWVTMDVCSNGAAAALIDNSC